MNLCSSPVGPIDAVVREECVHAVLLECQILVSDNTNEAIALLETKL